MVITNISLHTPLYRISRARWGVGEGGAAFERSASLTEGIALAVYKASDFGQ